MADIKTITLPSGNTYNIVDQGARDLIAGLSGSTMYLGVTTTELVDNVTTSPNIIVGGKTVSASAGGIATYGSKEFIYNGTVWQEFGDLSALGDLAYKDSASGKFTPNGSVSQPTFTGDSMTSTGNFKPSGTVTISKGTGTVNYTPEGTVSQPTFSGNETTSTGKFIPSGSVSLTNTATTPTLSKSTGTSSDYTIKEVSSVTVNASRTTPIITVEEGTSTNGYQVKGTISTPTITVTPDTTTVNSITAVGTLPTFTATVQNENLTFGWDAGTLPTKGGNTTVATGIQSATSTQPTFTGGYVKATSSEITVPTGTTDITNSYVKLTNGSINVPTSASFTGTEDDVSVTGTPSGTVSKPTFTGTGAELKGEFSGTQGSVSVTGTPSGTVSKPTFTGTEGTVTVS